MLIMVLFAVLFCNTNSNSYWSQKIQNDAFQTYQTYFGGKKRLQISNAPNKSTMSSPVQDRAFDERIRNPVHQIDLSEIDPALIGLSSAKNDGNTSTQKNNPSLKSGMSSQQTPKSFKKPNMSAIHANILRDDPLGDNADDKFSQHANIDSNIGDNFSGYAAIKDQTLRDLYHPPNVRGDDVLTYAMLMAGTKNKTAMINRSRFTKRVIEPYVWQELNDHENSIWWDNQDLEAEF
jgi:hypothetical protein